LDIGRQHGQQFDVLHHYHKLQRSHTPFVQGVETSDAGTEVVEPDPRCQ